jgi:DNA polymerase I-like protein with 3'-5' exonuclease and polymerase domains
MAVDRPFMFQVANIDGQVASFRGEVNPYTREVTWDNCRAEMRWLRSKVEDPKMTVVAHNMAFEIRMTAQPDIDWDWRCRKDDTKVMWRMVICDEMTYGLKALTVKNFRFPNDDEKALKKATQRARLAAKKRGWAIATKVSHLKNPAYADYWLPELTELVQTYGEADPIRCALLWKTSMNFFDKNKKEGGRLWDVYRWERKLLDTTLRMERYGMTYLQPVGKELHEFYTDYMRTMRRRLKKFGYGKLNLQSSKQMNAVFIETLGYDAKTYNRDNAGNVTSAKIDAEQLMAWARGSNAGADVDGDGDDGCPIARAALEWKAGKKVVEYLDSYEYFLCGRLDGSRMVHPGWDQAGAKTGRFSCHDPNTQQIASAETSRRHANMRARQREAWGPRPGYLWYLPDYSQIEVWVFAFVAKEKAMMRALLSGSDFHLSTAQAAWGHRDDFCTCGRWKEVLQEIKRNNAYIINWDLEKSRHKKGCLIKWWRQRAKMILFSRLYGGGIGKIAFLIRCSMMEAEEFVNDFNENLPGVRDYMNRVIDQVRDTGILTNLFGREYAIEKRFAYKAVNYMVQGSSAEILKRALVRIDKHLLANYDRSHLVGSVHDEGICEILLRDHSAALMRKIIQLMQMDSHYVPNLPVPLPVGMKLTSTSWNDAKEVYFLKRAA